MFRYPPPSGYRTPGQPYSRFGYDGSLWTPAMIGKQRAVMSATTAPIPPTPLVPISDAFWSTGGWWDLSTIPGVNGSTFAATVAPANVGGIGVFTPGSTGSLPIITDFAIGGKRGLTLDQTQPNYLRNDLLAPILNGSNKQYTIAFDAAVNTVGVPLANGIFFGWGSDQGPTFEDLFTAQFTNTAFGGSVFQGLAVYQQTTLGAVHSQNNPAPTLGYNYFRCIFSYDGTTLTCYVNGVLVVTTPSTWQAAAMIITRFMWGAWPVNGVGFAGHNGYIRRLGVRALPVTAPQVALIEANMLGNDLILPPTNPLVPEIFFAGASIIAATGEDLTTEMGIRYSVAQYILKNKLSIKVSGAENGFFGYRGCVAVPGSDAVSITAQCLAAVTSKTRLIFVELGNYEINSSETALQIQNTIALAWHNIRTGVYAVAPNCIFVTYNIPPYSTTPENNLAIATNAAYPGIWAASDAEFPSKPPIIHYDANTAIGGPSYVQANFNASGNPHPNFTGYTLLGAAAIAASGAALHSISPT